MHKMAKSRAASSCLLFCLLVLFLSSVSAVTDDHRQMYIVYMGSLPSRAEYTPMSDHLSILQEVTGESSIEGRMVRSYKRSFNGFAARLTASERERIAKMEGVVSVFPNKKLQLQTTVSWDFMGLKEGKGTKRNPTVESDTIIGVIDSGITPESQSFSDVGFGPPPKKWKGVCSGGENFTCNNKLIGARDYTSEGARDTKGHGTHTASTAAGNAVADRSFFGLGNGTVRGGVPASRIAAYKVCTEEGCSSQALLSAFDDAIADGVDLITISIGDKTAPMFETDPIAIGAFHAMMKGILTVVAAGNNGPKDRTVSSVAPWLLTVAASTTNRGFVTKVVLGNGKTLVGKTVNAFDMKGKKYPLVYGKSATSSACDAETAELCQPDCLEESLVKGKILVCGSPGGLKIVKSVGAIAIIYKSPKPDVAFVHPLPASGLQEKDFESLVSYIESSDSPQAAVLKTETIFNRTSPLIGSFSSRGPNTIVADILKPDITAPGVEILAAYSPEGEPSQNDTRHVKYSVLSGTSMSCPHVAGVAAYVKTFYPKWSPSMIQSAIMTTAWPVNATGTGIASTEFSYGAGHVNPIAALNPGLVYELDKADHIAFLCGLNYTSNILKIISGESVACSEEKEILPRNLNYPSMTAQLSGSNNSFTVTFNRTVTNVGTPNSKYISKVAAGHGSKLSVKVTPSVLSFKTVNEKQSFKVTVTGSDLDSELPSSANLIWSDGTHNVRSPIVVYTDVLYDVLAWYKMANPPAFFCLLPCLIVLLLCSVSAVRDDNQDQQVYVVYMGALPSSEVYTPMSDHMNILQGITGESSNEGRLLQTTNSWDFMGLKGGNKTNRNLAMESDTIIGVIDSGITPESKSFSDKGFGPPPKKWKGLCSGGKNFTCNNKLIGARDYTGEGSRDSTGHGTHTASTVAGNAVADTSFYGLGNGTVIGGVPASRIVTYKVCTLLGCSSDSILAAFDDAIADGVDMISISVGIGYASPFEEDPIAIGAFHATAKGILTVQSAGNSGPEAQTLESVAPWILTVAASNTNRAFLTKIVLGDGKTLVGRSVNTFDLNGKKYPLVYGKSAANSSACSVESAERCEEGCLQESLVKGKVVVCNSADSHEALVNGAVAGISINLITQDTALVTSLPLSTLSQEVFNSLLSYIKSESSPVATILRTEAIFSQTSPVVASFSARGPNIIATDILKPDVTAAGVEILASFSPEASPSSSVFDTRRVKYSVLSGTSMACPHVTGVATYIKTFHPKWSPSMIKSAIMTTAWPMNASKTGFASTEFAYGAGHVDPISATNPGLVYDSTTADYIDFLCGMNYNATTVKLISGEAVTCAGKTLPMNLNYPSMSAKISGSKSFFNVIFRRTVTNVGTPNSTYKSKVVLNQGSNLKAKTVNEKQSFKVTVTGSDLDSELPSSANLIWSDGTHNVRSPIVVYTDGY
ncbi:unnamed protein product [Thlaspi arvense]|uniref:Uncharacterized protein n=1 Tax=Thlaspi arvense TaxID=13288 RepID=A0AAU9SQD8_THLAR|nr:unnamed protein product [Thlaspi arvense]